MGWERLARNPWLWLAGAGLVALAARGSGSGLNPKAKPGPTPRDGAGCGYPRKDLPLAPAHTNAVLVQRVVDLIERVNPRVNTAAWNYGFRLVQGGKYSAALAKELVGAAQSARVPLDLLVALAQRESDFRPTVTTGQFQALGWGDEKIRLAVQNDWALGPLQTKPSIYSEVGLPNPIRWLGDPVPWSDDARLRDAVLAGARYLAKQKGRFGTWCAALHAYTVGPTAYANGARANGYVSQIIGWANDYTELRT